MFILEGISNSCYFATVIVVLFWVTFPGDIASSNDISGGRVYSTATRFDYLTNPLVIFLFIYTISFLIFELGELCSGKFATVPTIRHVV
jgi:hypothetical protein